MKVDSGEDDGGRYRFQTYYYSGLELDIVRGVVDRVASRAPSVATPSGLHSGLTFEAARQLLLAKGVILPARADTVDIGSCTAPDGTLLDGYVTLVFDAARRIQTIALVAARP